MSVLDFVSYGKRNALHASELAALTGCVNTRILRSQIAREREAGAVICSSADGYYRPANREELQEFIRSIEAHSRSCFRMLKSARAVLSALPGQVEMEGM